MSLMGYEVEDVERMLDAVNEAIDALPPEPKTYKAEEIEGIRERTTKNLKLTADLLQGLLEEGRI